MKEAREFLQKVEEVKQEVIDNLEEIPSGKFATHWVQKRMPVDQYVNVFEDEIGNIIIECDEKLMYLVAATYLMHRDEFNHVLCVVLCEYERMVEEGDYVFLPPGKTAEDYPDEITGAFLSSYCVPDDRTRPVTVNTFKMMLKLFEEKMAELLNQGGDYEDVEVINYRFWIYVKGANKLWHELVRDGEVED